MTVTNTPADQRSYKQTAWTWQAFASAQIFQGKESVTYADYVVPQVSLSRMDTCLGAEKFNVSFLVSSYVKFGQTDCYQSAGSPAVRYEAKLHEIWTKVSWSHLGKRHKLYISRRHDNNMESSNS